MSEAERKRRLNYKKNRKKCIFVQAIALVIVALLIIASVFVYMRLDKDYYINYTENGSVDYKVKLHDNEFYGEDKWAPSGQAYVSSLISEIRADFLYELNMETDDMEFYYSYNIDAVLEIVDKTTGAVIFTESDNLVSKKDLTHNSSSKLSISEKNIFIDYAAYNKLANDFVNMVDRNKLDNTESVLKVKMSVDVVGSSEKFESDSVNSYFTSLDIPMTKQVVNIQKSASVAEGENKVLLCKSAGNKDTFKTAAIILGGVELILLLLFIGFIFITRNHDVNYSIRVQKLLSSYRSFIQRITNGFDTKGYQILIVGSFNEMLSIRDTIQSPILMSENTDQTRTQFFIPTNTKLLYMYEIKVDNYDELYSNPEWTDDSIIQTELPEELVNRLSEQVANAASDKLDKAVEDKTREITDSVVKEATPKVVEEASSAISKEEPDKSEELTYDRAADLIVNRLINRLVEAEQARLLEDVAAPVQAPVEELTESEETLLAACPIPEIVENAEIIDDQAADDEVYEETDANGNKIIIHFSRSVTSRIIQSDPTVKGYYSELKNYILSHKGVKCRTSWKHESYNKGRKQLFKLKIRGKTILLYCALDPADYEYTRYFHEKAEAKAYKDVPMLVRIRSDRGLRRAKELVDEIMATLVLPVDPKIQPVDYVAENPYETTRALIDRALIKVLTEEAKIPEETPAIEDAVVVADPIAPEAEPLMVEAVSENNDPAEEPSVESLDLLNMDEDGEDSAWQSSGLKISRSFVAKVAQCDDETKGYYSELKNCILSYKGVKARASWKCETYKKGKSQLVKLKLRGKMILVYLALDHTEDDYTSYAYEISDSKAYSDVPMMVKIKSSRGLAKAKRLIEILMEKKEIAKDPKATDIDYVAENPYRTSEALMDEGLLKILISDKKVDIDDRRGFTVSAIVKALATPDIDLETLDFLDSPDVAYEGEGAKEVVSVVIPEGEKNNKVYRYDPDGESLERGDVVLVPKATGKSGRKTLKKAAVTEGNHKVDEKKLEGPIEKIFGIVKRKIEELLSK